MNRRGFLQRGIASVMALVTSRYIRFAPTSEPAAAQPLPPPPLVTIPFFVGAPGQPMSNNKNGYQTYLPVVSNDK